MVLPGIGSTSPFFQSLTSSACAISAGVSCMDRRHHDVFLDAEHFRRDLREFLGDRLVDVPVALAFPHRIDRRRQRVDEGMHVGGVEIVLLVPGRGRQHDVRVDAGRGHAEVERDQQDRAFPSAPRRARRLPAASCCRSSPRSLPCTPWVVPSRCLRKYSWPLPDEPSKLERHTNMLRGQLSGWSGSSQANCNSPDFSAFGHIVLRLEAGGLRLLGDVERILLELRRRRQPAHALGAHIVVDQRAVPRPGRRGRRQDFIDAYGLVTPLIGMRVEERGRVLLARRPAQSSAKRQRQPARLRAQLLLADIMRPAAARLADAAAHHQHVDDAAVVHVAVVPMVHGGADDHHRAALGLLGVEREFARHRNDLVARHAADLLRPGRRIGHVVVIGFGDMLAAEAAIEPVIGDEKVEHRGDQRLAVLQLHALGRHLAHQHARMIGAGEVIVLAVAEIGEADVGEFVFVIGEGQLQFGVAAVGLLFLQIPLALLAPAEADRAARHHDRLSTFRHRRRFSIPDCWSRRDCRRNRKRAADGRAPDDRPSSPAAPASACRYIAGHSPRNIWPAGRDRTRAG